MSRAAVAATLVAVSLTGACGVRSEDRPQPIEDSSVEQPAATPSVESEPEPTPTPGAPSFTDSRSPRADPPASPDRPTART